MHGAQGLFVRSVVSDQQFAGVFIHDQAPQPLQETLRADDSACFPGARHGQRAHRHFVDSESVSAEGRIHFVRCDDVLERFAHLAVFAADFLTFVPVGGCAGIVRALFDICRGHVDPARIRVGIGLDIPLVDQAVERLGRRNVSQVEQNLVPEAGVEQVQDSVFDTADVQTGTPGGALGSRPQPVGLVDRIDSGVIICRVGVAQLVPRRSRPVGHGVGFTAVLLGTIAQVEGDIDPLFFATQRRFGFRSRVVSIKGARREVVHFRQVDGQLLFRQGVRNTVFVIDDGERLTPVALAGEKPVAQTVLRGFLSKALTCQPFDDSGFRGFHFQAVDVDLSIG